MTVAKSWAFTKNNYTSDDIFFFADWPDFRYMVFGRENAPSTGTPHLQGYFTLSKAVRPSYLKKTLPEGTHFEVARKSLLANFRYCSKCSDYTEIDRRYGRKGNATSVTRSALSGASQDFSDSGKIPSPQIEKLLPKFPLRILFSNKRNALSETTFS